MKTKIEIIEETVEYYSRPNTRAEKNGYCQYFDEQGKSCAVGRCLENPRYFQTKYGNDTIDVSFNDDLFKKEYKGHSVEFWSDLQNLHDRGYHWDINGLTKDGENCVKILKEKYATDNN